MYLLRPAQVKSMCGKHCTQCETAETVFDLSHKQPTVITWSEFWTYVRTTWNNKKKKHMKNSFKLCEEGRKEHWPTFFFIWVHFDMLTWVRCSRSFFIGGAHILTFTWGSSGKETAVGVLLLTYWSEDLLRHVYYYYLFLILEVRKVHFCYQLPGNSVSGFKC